jgi:hypothetical protein
MTTVLDDPTTHAPPATRLRTTMAAVRLSISWFGIRKTLTAEQKARAASTFGAEGNYLSAGKKLLNTSHPEYRALTSVRSRIQSYFNGISLPYPEPAVRLIRQGDIQTFDAHLTTLKAELSAAVRRLDTVYAELKSAAQQRLGSLYDERDYPESLNGLFSVEYDFPSVEPPDYLRQLNPELYRQECQRVRARFDEAVELAEQSFVDELASLVTHLTERLAGHDDGAPKIFRDSAVENLSTFFERFRTLNIGSNEQLDGLVDQVQGIVRGVKPQQLRDQQSLRQHVATELSAVTSVLDGLLVDRPRRNIIRRPK